jgi:hypothetical protein
MKNEYWVNSGECRHCQRGIKAGDRRIEAALVTFPVTVGSLVHTPSIERHSAVRMLAHGTIPNPGDSGPPKRGRALGQAPRADPRGHHSDGEGERERLKRRRVHVAVCLHSNSSPRGHRCPSRAPLPSSCPAVPSVDGPVCHGSKYRNNQLVADRLDAPNERAAPTERFLAGRCADTRL